jgi:hypothetical protein
MSVALKVPENTATSIILKLKKFVTTSQTAQSGEKGRTFQKDIHLCSTPPIRPLWWSGQTEAIPQ